MRPDSEKRRPLDQDGAPTTSSTTIAPTPDTGQQPTPRERVQWSSNGASVTVGRWPVAPSRLDLGDGVTVKITGNVWEITPGTWVVDEGARVTITGRLSESLRLPLRRAEGGDRDA